MNNWNKMEPRRLELQEELDSQKTPLARNKAGQFATPTALARDVVGYGVGLLGKKEKIKFFDPGFGLGSFYSALQATVPETKTASAFGFEIDEHYGKPSQQLWSDSPLRLEIADFTEQEPSANDLANLVICNPPYVRHHHLSQDKKADLLIRTEKTCGIRLNGLSGLYCYFLGLTHKWMESGAVAGWLIPSEFMDVNYGRQVKDYLLNKVTLLHIHRFDPEDQQFGDALVSSAVVWFKNEKPKSGHSVCFSYGGSLAKPHDSKNIPVSVLRESRKWTQFPHVEHLADKPQVRLGDLFDIKRGLATGDNKFFIKTAEEIAELELPNDVFRPVLPSTRYVPDNIVRSEEDGTPVLAKKLFLLDTNMPEEEIKQRYPKLWEYLEKGKEGKDAVSQRYLCRTRKTWYTQEKRPPAPILCSYMGRQNGGGNPFRFILNDSDATATNVYLMLYPKESTRRLLEERPKLMHTVWEFLNSVSPQELKSNGRVYGGGLHKLEPKELRELSVDGLVASIPELVAQRSSQKELFA